MPTKPFSQPDITLLNPNSNAMGDGNVLCPPSGRRYFTGPHGGLPSPPDWHISGQHGLPLVVIDRQSLARYGATTLNDSVLYTSKNGTPVWLNTPTAAEFANSYMQFSRNAAGCTRP